VRLIWGDWVLNNKKSLFSLCVRFFSASSVVNVFVFFVYLVYFVVRSVFSLCLLWFKFLVYNCSSSFAINFSLSIPNSIVLFSEVSPVLIFTGIPVIFFKYFCSSLLALPFSGALFIQILKVPFSIFTILFLFDDGFTFILNLDIGKYKFSWFICQCYFPPLDKIAFLCIVEIETQSQL